MNGRSAKGSIKDRLISMLYRLRYQSKKIKEEDYTIDNKNKQIEYLNHLENFKSNENISNLSKEEKNNLDKVKFNAKGFLFEKEKDINFKTINIELNKIEMKNSELMEKVDLKKEIKKTNNEIIILTEVNNFVKDSLKNINSIELEINEIKEETKNNNKSTDDLEIRYNKLKSKIEKLKLQYDVVKNRYDLSEFKILESIKLIDGISDYKNQANLNEIEMMLKVCKKEINKISNVIVLNEENKKVGNNIETLKNDQNNVKLKFKKSKENVDNLFLIKNNIEKELKIQNEIINDLYSKASYFEKKYKKRIIFLRKGNLLSSYLRIAGGLLTLPLTGLNIFGIAVGHTLINRGLKSLNMNVIRKEKIDVYYEYEDITNKVNNVKDKIEYTNLIITDSLNEIQKIKENVDNIYSKYNSILPEYNSIIYNINNLEQKLVYQQEKLCGMNKKIDEEKRINKEKLKKIGK